MMKEKIVLLVLLLMNAFASMTGLHFHILGDKYGIYVFCIGLEPCA